MEQPQLTSAQERRLCRAAAAGDGTARDQLVVAYMPLCRRLAARYRNTSLEAEDLEQVANMALVKAVDRFDTSLGNAFLSFAIPTILGELKRYIRDHAWIVRVPRSLQERRGRVSQVIAKLTSELGRPPTLRQVAETLDLTLDEVLEAERAGEAFEALSLDKPGENGDDVRSLGERVGADDVGYEFAEYSVAAEGALSDLSDRDRDIFRMRFFEDLTQTEIGERVELSQMQVSRILRDVVESLRAAAITSEGG